VCSCGYARRAVSLDTEGLFGVRRIEEEVVDPTGRLIIFRMWNKSRIPLFTVRARATGGRNPGATGVNEQGAIVRNLLELNDEFIRVLGVRECLGSIERNNMVSDDLVRLVRKVGFLTRLSAGQ
jgi:hypothetical protein